MTKSQELDKLINDELTLQTHNRKTKGKLLDELNRQMEMLTHQNTEKQNLDLQIQIDAQNLEDSNRQTAEESDAPEPESSEEEPEMVELCETCGASDHESSRCPRLTLT